MEYLKVVFTLNVANEDMEAAKDLLADLAAAAGFEAFEETDDKLVGYVQPQLLDKAALDEAIADFPITSARIAYEMVEAENRNWNEEWEANGFEPICIEGRCIIFDARHYSAADLPAGFHLQVAIEPRQAFGTGTHETTQMVVAQLLGMPLQGKRLLDCGCGTGILAILASLRGAKHCVAVDFDEWCVRNTRDNLALNPVGEIEVVHGDATALDHRAESFDLVIANINRNILLADLPRYVAAMRSGAHIYMSGFYTADVAPLRERAEALGLTFVDERSREDWACLKFRKA